MSIHFDASRDRFVVRWKQDGRCRVRRFRSEADAIAFDASLLRPLRPARMAASVPSAAAGDGIYAYETRGGSRFRFVFRQSDGKLSTRRGFTSRRAAVTARRRLVESIELGEVKVARETFETFCLRLLEERRPYMTKGSSEDFATHGRKRLLPSLGATPLARIDEQLVRRWMHEMVALVESGELAPKTIGGATSASAAAAGFRVVVVGELPSIPGWSIGSCGRAGSACTSPRRAPAIRSSCCTAGPSTGTAGDD